MTEPFIKVDNVQRVKRANGKVDLYFRSGSHREGPLSSPDGSEALRDEVQAIKDRLADPANAPAPKLKASTVGAVLKHYQKSAEYLALGARTKVGYDSIIEELTADIGDTALSEVTRSWVMDLRDAWAARGYRAADFRIQVLKNALLPIVLDETDDRITGDPFKKVKKVPRPFDLGEAHLVWSDLEVSVAIEDAIVRGWDGLARAIALCRYAGFRRGTACRVPLYARIVDYNADGELENRIYWLTEKRKILADLREDPDLTSVLARTPNRALTIAYNKDGQPWKERQLNQAIDRHMARLAKAGKVRAAVDEDGKIYCPLDIHGLRHARGVQLAHAGNSDAQIMAQFAHSTPAAAIKYRRQAERRKLADAAQDMVDNVTKLRTKKKTKNKEPSTAAD